MSSTMVFASTTTTTLFTDRPSCCSNCGTVIEPQANAPSSTSLLEAQARIAELETQTCLLNQKAAAAVERWHDYEAQLTKLKAQVPHRIATSGEFLSTQSPTRGSSLFSAGASRLSALVSPRMWSGGNSPRTPITEPTPAAAAAPASALLPAANISPPARANTMPLSSSSSPSSQTAEDLLEALSHEKSLRHAAESRLSATSKEVEELSAALFEQANEMVATERRARAKLEQRVGELERRDAEKKQRLERLELAMDRIERVRNLLSESHAEALAAAIAADESSSPSADEA